MNQPIGRGIQDGRDCGGRNYLTHGWAPCGGRSDTEGCCEGQPLQLLGIILGSKPVIYQHFHIPLIQMRFGLNKEKKKPYCCKTTCPRPVRRPLFLVQYKLCSWLNTSNGKYLTTLCHGLSNGSNRCESIRFQASQLSKSSYMVDSWSCQQLDSAESKQQVR